MIELRGVTLEIGGRCLLGGLDARIDSGEFVAVVGPNGVGKTTLLRAIAGLHPLAAGHLTVDGADIAHLAPALRARKLAFVTSDEVFLDALRVRDAVAIGRYPHHRWWQWRGDAHDDEAVESALECVGIAPLADRLISTLSSGERQRVWLGMGLAQETPVLLLDEPTSHLDARVAHDILALLADLARNGRTVVCVLHDLNDAAAYADRIALLGDQRLCAIETPDRLLASGELDRIYGIPIERVRMLDGSLRVFAGTLRR